MDSAALMADRGHWTENEDDMPGTSSGVDFIIERRLRVVPLRARFTVDMNQDVVAMGALPAEGTSRETGWAGVWRVIVKGEDGVVYHPLSGNPCAEL